MDVVGERGRVFDDDVGVPKAPAAPLSPVVVRRVPKCGEEPPYAVNRAREIRDPQLDVVESPASRRRREAPHEPAVVEGGTGADEGDDLRSVDVYQSYVHR